MPLSILYESELKSLEDNRALLTSVLSDINISLHSIFNRNHCYLTVTNCFLKVFLTQTVLFMPCIYLSGLCGFLPFAGGECALVSCLKYPRCFQTNAKNIG